MVSITPTIPGSPSPAIVDTSTSPPVPSISIIPTIPVSPSPTILDN